MTNIQTSEHYVDRKVLAKLVHRFGYSQLGSLTKHKESSSYTHCILAISNKHSCILNCILTYYQTCLVVVTSETKGEKKLWLYNQNISLLTNSIYL